MAAQPTEIENSGHRLLDAGARNTTSTMTALPASKTSTHCQNGAACDDCLRLGVSSGVVKVVHLFGKGLLWQGLGPALPAFP